MRRDVIYYFEADVVSTYKAYLAAAKSRKFDRSCSEEPYHTFSFGINYSMIYNMNGGSCTLHFMPYRTGCAVDLRFSIAQLVGARYERYAQNLTEIAEQELGVRGSSCHIDVEEFLRPENRITPANCASVQRTPAKPVVAGRSCPKCGNAVGDNAAFCVKCGQKLNEETVQFCTQCGTKLPGNAVFCSHCGNKVK